MTSALRPGQRVVVWWPRERAYVPGAAAFNANVPEFVVVDFDTKHGIVRAPVFRGYVHPLRDASEVRARKRGAPTMWDRVAERICECDHDARDHWDIGCIVWVDNAKAYYKCECRHFRNCAAVTAQKDG